MARAKSNTMLEFLDRLIAQKEKQLLENNGTIPAHFDALCRYHETRKYYAPKKEATK